MSGTLGVTGDVTVGVNDTGHDVKFFGASAGAYILYDQSCDQLEIRGAAADAATSTGKLLLTTALTDINANDVIGSINFQAPLEAGGTDAITVAAGIRAVAQATFTCAVNATDLIFYTGHSEAATEKFRFTSQNEIGIAGANYGTDGQVLTSGGAGAAAAWEDASAGGRCVAGDTDNGLITWVTSDNTFAAESGLTFSSGVLQVDSESTSVSSIVSIEVDASSSGDPTVRWREGSGNGDANNQQYEAWMDTSGGQFRFRSQNIDGSSAEGDVWTINDGTNDVKFNGGVGISGTAPQTSGIAFPACQAASSDANTLDDYEEGAWTPALNFGGGDTSITYSANNLGTYEKIGRSVFYRGVIYLTNKGSSTGSASITGLPFTGFSAYDSNTPSAIWAQEVSFANFIIVRKNNASATISVLEVTEAGSETAITNSEFTNNSIVAVNGHYRI